MKAAIPTSPCSWYRPSFIRIRRSARPRRGTRCIVIPSAALFHDSSEVITGDMPTPVKYNNPALKSAYKDLEKTADEKLLSMLPDFLREEYEKYFNVDISSDEGRLIKAADKISAYIKCVEETLSGNGEFAIAEKTTLNAIDVDLPEVKYFMDNCLEGFFKPLDVLK